MAGKGNPKTGGRDFKKGQSGNPSGKNAYPIEVNRLKRLSAQEYAQILCDVMYAKESELLAIEIDLDEPVLRRTCAGVMLKAMNNKCVVTLDYLINRVVGRVRDVSPTEEDKSRKVGAVLEELRKVIHDPGNERA